MSDPESNYTLALISNITHQAINPLNGVIGTLDNLIDGTIEGARREQRLKSARAQLEYTVSLIRNLAYFAQYGTDAAQDLRLKSKKTCVIPQLLIEAALFFQEQGTTNHVRIEVIDKAVQNSVQGDPELLRQVFMNLFDNFVKYGEPESIVDVKHWIQRKTGDLIVTLSGRSTPFETSEDIFAIGVRGRAAAERTSSGSGLGLHICKLIVERLFNGNISASYVFSSRLANFEVRIPGAFIKER
ncbi:histidine kinase/DNA gyrase B/HSP90-like ATPase [Tahibacter aquaticus]|uniref:Histidine kinase/DNA gyrase B/HSP90-like ATPase n=1 Tax=Tahibacter aquaticus TaxID=520092 RepID=A0A4V3DLH8_9GAMM|nr:ATP-binding protein [Tahibacter aquaticus]TDR39641.1 histidine kinase/DNA gyrase B/HSP90-like ATPase [Tahibacter aquaticus]